MKLSVAIPCWSMNGVGKDVLKYSLDIISNQTFKDFEVVITDHSIDDDIKNLCENYSFVKYIRNENQRGNPSHNTNLGLKNCSGEYIKLLCQDDYLYGNDALETCYSDLKDSGKVWGFNSYFHTRDKVNLERLHIPSYNPNIELINTLGTPSALIIKNELNVYLDENLKYYYDCEFYKRLTIKYGLPNVSNKVTMINYIHENQTTNTIANNELRSFEENYIRRKYFC